LRLDRDGAHVVVSDIGLPGKDGYDLIRAVRQRHDAKAMPAIAVTAFARAEDRMLPICPVRERCIFPRVGAMRPIDVAPPTKSLRNDRRRPLTRRMRCACLEPFLFSPLS